MRAFPGLRAALPRSRKTFASIAALVGAVFAIACGDTTTTAPATQASSLVASSDRGPGGSASLADSANCVQALQRLNALPSAVTYTKVISSSGGRISVPEADFELEIPSGAFDGNSLTFTVTAYAGATVAYDFQPHGTVFKKPLKAIQHLDHTNWGSQKLPNGYFPSLTGAYFSDTTKFSLKTGWGIVDEFESTQLSDGGKTVTWQIPHFSGYIVASGRR